MHRVPVLVKVARRYNAVLLRGELVAAKTILEGERVTVKHRPAADAADAAATTPPGRATYGRRLGSDDPGSAPVFDDDRYAY